MTLRRMRTTFRDGLAGGAAILAVAVMLLQPLCAPLCSAKHCGARTGSGGAGHCEAVGGPQEDSIAAQERGCSAALALPAILGAEIRQPSSGERSDPLPSSLAAASPRLEDGSAFTCPHRALASPSRRDSGTSLSTILRV